MPPKAMSKNNYYQNQSIIALGERDKLDPPERSGPDPDPEPIICGYCKAVEVEADKEACPECQKCLDECYGQKGETDVKGPASK